MPRNTQTVNCQCNANRSRIRFALVSLLLVPGSSTVAQAATIPFTFAITTDTFLIGVPSPTTLTLPTTVSGSGSFAPFGSAIYTEAGTITFAILPSGDFVPFSVMNNFTASFNGGADTFTGTDSVTFGATTFTNNWTTLGGTGIFSGATGSATATGMPIASSGNPDPTYFGTVANSGSGQVTAPGLTAVPEPTTMTLLDAAMASLGGLAAIRNKRKGSTAK